MRGGSPIGCVTVTPIYRGGGRRDSTDEILGFKSLTTLALDLADYSCSPIWRSATFAPSCSHSLIFLSLSFSADQYQYQSPARFVRTCQSHAINVNAEKSIGLTYLGTVQSTETFREWDRPRQHGSHLCLSDSRGLWHWGLQLGALGVWWTNRSFAAFAPHGLPTQVWHLLRATHDAEPYNLTLRESHHNKGAFTSQQRGDTFS